MEFFLLYEWLLRKLRHTLANITFNVLYFLRGSCGKIPKTWVFGSPPSQKFTDNSKHLFLYVTNNHPILRAFGCRAILMSSKSSDRTGIQRIT